MSDLPTFWHTLNTSMSAEEREEFNQWRAKLWVLADWMQDKARALDIVLRDGFEKKERVMSAQASELMETVSRIPVLAV